MSILKKNIKLDDTYTLLEELGHGGGGVVYKAYHERLNTYVVVKKIKDQVKEKIEIRAEADILKNMKHTYLPRVYDFLEIENEIYTVIDYIPGKSLDKVIAENKRISQKEVFKWAVQLSEALDYLHRQTPPVIHSDIKPANIMLTPEGNICLIDFNISLAFDSSMKTSIGISGGYSPPEQYRNLVTYQKFTQIKRKQPAPHTQKETELDKVRKTYKETEIEKNTEQSEKIPNTESLVESTIGRGIDTRSDIYSLGAALYHLLTGIKPDNNFEKIIPIDQCDIDLGEGFTCIIRKMMELLPEKRYQNGSELLYAFHHIYDLDREFQAYKKRRRNGKTAIILLYLTGGILVGSGWAVRQNEIDTDYNRYVAYAEEQTIEGDFDEAAAVLDKALSLRPKRIEAYKEKALWLYQTGDYAGCIRYCTDILQNPAYVIEEKDESSLADIFYMLGNSYIETEEYSNAAQNLEEAIALCNKNGLYYRDYAIALAKMGSISEAETALENAVSLQLGEDSVCMAQGEIAYAKKEYTAAEEYLLQAVSSADDDSLRKRAVLLCDKVYRAMGADYINQEIAFLEQEENQSGGTTSAMSIKERLADAYVRKAESDEKEQKNYYEKAIVLFHYLYENGYATQQMMENIALLYQQMGDYEKAKDMLLEMGKKYPDSYVGFKYLAYLEAYIQQEKENIDREYRQMKVYYDKAKELYGDRNDDQEMQMLDSMIEDLKNGNWL